MARTGATRTKWAVSRGLLFLQAAVFPGTRARWPGGAVHGNSLEWDYMTQKRHTTVGVKVGKVMVGGGAPIVVQSMTNTDTADIASTTQQCFELAQAGSEIVRITVNVPEAAAAVSEIKKRLLDAGCNVPLIGDFHYNGHVLLTKYPRLRRGARQVPHQSRKRGPRSTARRAVCNDLQSGARAITNRCALA